VVEVKDKDLAEEEPVDLVKNSKTEKGAKNAKIEKPAKVPQDVPKIEENRETVTGTGDDQIYNGISAPVLPTVRRMPVTPPSFDMKPKRKIGRWPFIVVGVIAIIVIIGYFASVYYSQATFTIVPKVIPVAVNSTYVAQGTPQANGLSYEVVTLRSSATTTVAATNGPVTNSKATGKVTFYNTFSNQSIRLIAGTRLTNEAGLIYRLSSSIVIPGNKASSTPAVPGKIMANIVADQSGQNYNMPKSTTSSDLKIVAYNGTPKSAAVYARPVADISGGFAGTKKIINPAVVASSTTALKNQIIATLEENLKSAVPSGFLLYANSDTTTFTAPIIGGNDPANATVSLQGTIYGIVFPKDKFIEAVAGSQTTSLFSPFAFTVPGLESLDVTITNLKDFSPVKKGALVVRAKGNIKIIGTIPVDEIKKKLAGISLAGTQDVFKSYSPIIESGSGELAPPWAKIPTDLKRVKVVVQEP
jgi:hypothetical protein